MLLFLTLLLWVVVHIPSRENHQEIITLSEGIRGVPAYRVPERFKTRSAPSTYPLSVHTGADSEYVGELGNHRWSPTFPFLMCSLINDLEAFLILLNHIPRQISGKRNYLSLILGLEKRTGILSPSVAPSLIWRRSFYQEAYVIWVMLLRVK